MAIGNYSEAQSYLIKIAYESVGAAIATKDSQKVREAISALNKQVTTQTPKATSNMNTFFKMMGRALIVAPAWMLVRNAMMSVFNLISSQTKFLIDLEDAMARIQIVGKGTTEQFNSLKLALVGLSQAYGVSASEAMNAAKIFAQQGKTVDETLTLTRIAMKGSQVLEKDIKTTVEDLTAAMNSFNIPASQASSIIDKLINVEKQFAVTSADLADGIKVTGATANQMGVTLSALAGDITAVIEVTRKSGSEAARGLQFMYARLLTSARPVVEQLTGIKFYLDANNKATSALTGTLRPATAILDELADAWGNLTNAQQLSIAAALGSKRQMATVNALMQNYNRSIDARVASLTSAGKAEQAFNILQDTTSFKLKQLTSAWNLFTVALSDTGWMKDGITLVNEIVTGWASIINPAKAYEGILAQQADRQMAVLETEESRLSNIKELLNLQSRLQTGAGTDKNIERLKLISNELDAIQKRYPSLNFSTMGTTDIDKEVSKLQDALLRRRVTWQVMPQFEAQLDVVRKRKQYLVSEYGIETSNKKVKKEITDLDKKTLDINKKQREEVENQYKQAKLIKALNAGEVDEETTELMGFLTDKEKEQLDIERKLTEFKIDGTKTVAEQLKYEMELVKNADVIYDAHAKNLKLSQLELELDRAKVDEYTRQVNTIADLALQYEKLDRNSADYYKQKRELELVAELATASPQYLASAFGTGRKGQLEYDAIVKYWDVFSQEAKNAMIKTSDLFMYYSPMKPTLGATGVANQAVAPQAQQIYNTVNKAADAINVIVNSKGGASAEEIAELAKKSILGDKDFQNAFVNKTRPIT